MKKKVGYETWVLINFQDIDEEVFGKTLDKFIAELTKILIRYDKNCTIKKRMIIGDYGASRAAIMSDKTIVYYSYEVSTGKWLNISLGIEAKDKASLLRMYAGDDKVIKKISNLLKGKVFNSMIELISVIERENRAEQIRIVNNWAPSINAQIKTLFALCTKIKDKKLAVRVQEFLGEVFHVEHGDYDNAVQNFFEATDYTMIDLDELTELTLDGYLQTHSIDQAFGPK